MDDVKAFAIAVICLGAALFVAALIDKWMMKQWSNARNKL